ncbi:MAG: hypothetical protein ACTHM6_14305, partial [Tepidisphaeraceae bacterium]
VVACGNFFVDVLLNDALDAVALFAWLGAGWGYGRILLSAGPRHPAPPKTPADDRLFEFATTTALGLGVMGLLTLGLGLAGWLGQASAVGLLVVGLAAAAFFLRHTSFATLRNALRERTSPGLILLAAPMAVVVIAASLSPGFLWKPLDPHPYDVLSYHLQIPREWFDAGKIIPLLHNSFSFFPMGMEMHDLLAMHLYRGPWAAMYLCQFMSAAFGGLTVLGVVGALRAGGHSKGFAWIAGLAVACVPWVTMLSSVAYVEPGVMCYSLLSVAWALRAIRHGADESKDSPADPSAGVAWKPFILAGAFAAFACGMKYTAVPMTARPVLRLLPFFAGKRSWKPWLIGCCVCAALFAPWLVRNYVWAHNPVFPLATRLFGAAHFTPDQVDRYLTAHAPPMAERSVAMRLTNAWHRVALDPQFGYLLLPMTIAALLLGIARRRGAYLALVILATSLVWLLATHDMPRFLAPAIPLAILLIGNTARRFRWGAWAAGALLLVQAVVGLGWTWQVLDPSLELGRQGLFRMADLSVIETDETKAARTSGDRVALIGDAQAFFYVMPSDKLIYRGVFDVVIPPGTNTVDGWLDKSVDELRHEGYWVVINTSELNRLSQTYAHIPKPPPPYDQVTPAPIVLPPIR